MDDFADRNRVLLMVTSARGFARIEPREKEIFDGGFVLVKLLDSLTLVDSVLPSTIVKSYYSVANVNIRVRAHTHPHPHTQMPLKGFRVARVGKFDHRACRSLCLVCSSH